MSLRIKRNKHLLKVGVFILEKINLDFLNNRDIILSKHVDQNKLQILTIYFIICS